ncbi:hypothetical protein GY45DRAFT_1250755 [Cubamyces sp. BRFM 1775]|nr:hypothetical protein GY45DRAFT_1250755 [Cubamyces sp. BRFM 1775]
MGRRPVRRRNPLVVKPYDSSDDEDGTVPSGDGNGSDPTRPRRRPPLGDKTAWALVPVAGHGNTYVVERWVNWQHHSKAFPLWTSISGDLWSSITRLKLEIDSMQGQRHDHSLYQLENDTDDGFPNALICRELVQLCRDHFPQLIGLSISMCIPELTIPHIPRFVYEILAVSPRLKYLGIEDTQCMFFERASRGLFSHLAAIVMHDIQSGHADLPPSATLDTLVISKRSILLETEYPRYAFERMLDARLQFVPALPPYHPEGIVNLQNGNLLLAEAYKLARLMYAEIPSLRRGYVSLNRGALNFRADVHSQFQALSAGELYLLQP